MGYLDPVNPIGDEVASSGLLSLDQPNLVNLESALVTLRSGGPSFQIMGYSINGGPMQLRSDLAIVDPDHPALMSVSLHGQGRTFQPGENEFRFLCLDGSEFTFMVRF